MSAENLQPEYRNAIQVLSDKLPSLTNTLPPTDIPRQVFQQGNTLKFEGIVIPRRIPGHTAWRWNQSKSKQKVQMMDGSHVEMIKLIPRRRAIRERHQSVPSYKLWLFHYFSSATSRFSVTWCEKGTETHEAGSPAAHAPASTPSSPVSMVATPDSMSTLTESAAATPEGPSSPSQEEEVFSATRPQVNIQIEEDYELMSGGIAGGSSLESSPSQDLDYDGNMGQSSFASYPGDIDFSTLLSEGKRNSISLSTPMDLNSDTWLSELLAHY